MAPLLVIGGLALAACEDDASMDPASFSSDAAVDFSDARADAFGIPDAADADAEDAADAEDGSSGDVPDGSDMDAADADSADAEDGSSGDITDAADAALECDGGSVICDGVCVPRLGTVDQEQNTTSAGRDYLWKGRTFVQTFTAGASGRLVGVEVYVQRTHVGPDPEGSLRLTVRDANDVALGSAEVDLSQFPIDNSPHQLGDEPGAGYFDLAGACIPITAGRGYRFELELVGIPMGVCTANSCTAGRLGEFCYTDSNCDYAVGIEFSKGDPYPGGAFVGGFDDEDFIFRTYVR